FLPCPSSLDTRPSSPPSCHARAPHHREARVDAVAGIGRADADKIVKSAKPSISTHQSAQPVARHDLVGIEISPVRPFPEAPIPTKTQIQAIGNANEPKLQGVQPQAVLQNLVSRTPERGLNIHTCKSFALGESQRCQEV